MPRRLKNKSFKKTRFQKAEESNKPIANIEEDSKLERKINEMQGCQQFYSKKPIGNICLFRAFSPRNLFWAQKPHELIGPVLRHHWSLKNTKNKEMWLICFILLHSILKNNCYILFLKPTVASLKTSLLVALF